MAVIEAYVTNLGKYNEGELASAASEIPHHQRGGTGSPKTDRH